MYQPRTYRRRVHSPGLVTYAIIERETDLYISTTTDLSGEARQLVHQYRRELESYIAAHPCFAASLEPVAVEDEAPQIVREMAQAASVCGVGPMAAVAGAIARFVGEALGRLSPEVIIENGGDIYVKSTQQRVVSIYAGGSPLSYKIGIEIEPRDTPIGVCTSSATVGPSLSFGASDASVAVAPSAALADAAATAIGNAVKSAEDIERGLAVARGIDRLSGAVIIVGHKLGAWGHIRLRDLK